MTDRRVITRAIAERVPGRRLAAHRRSWIIRPDDLLVLDFGLENLRVVAGEKGAPAHLERTGSGPAFLVVTLPPQNIAEEAYFTTVEEYPIENSKDPDKGKPASGDEPLGKIPIDARLAGWSRLVFRVRDENLPIDWTLEGVLRAIPDLELNVAPNALPPRDPPPRFNALLEAALLPSLIASGIPSAGGVAAGGVAAGGVAAGGFARAESGRAESVRSVLTASRMLQAQRTLGHSLGLSEATGSATLLKFADAIEKAFLNPSLARAAPRPPTALETALELPYRLILSPNRHAAWLHSDTAVSSDETGHTELWHTRLGVRSTDGVPLDGASPLRTLRAIWTTDEPSPTTPIGDSIPDHSNDDPFRSSLDGLDRHNVVHLSSNFQLHEQGSTTRFFEPRPLDVNHLSLSAMGAWLDSRGVWDEQPDGLELEEWRHVATLGRDHFVRVVYAGRLFPLGHRASLVKITERRFETAPTGQPAYLRQRMFLIVREPLRAYGSSGLVENNEQWDLKFPFKAARIKTLVSPLLDDPKSGEVAPGKLQAAFWPYVGGQPFRFDVVATDHDDRPIDLAIPLIFVGKKEGDEDHAKSLLPNTIAKEQYVTRKWPNSNQLLATVRLGGQRVAFAASAEPDDTTFAVESLTFGAEVPDAPTYDDKMDKREPRYVPVVRTAKLTVPALQQIAQTNDAAALVYDQTFLQHGFGSANAGEVFLAADKAASALTVAFSSKADRSGGFFAPDLSLSGLSRITGPVSGDVALSAAGTLDPKAWFGAIADARLFGAVKLSEIFKLTDFGAPDTLPRFVGELADAVQRAVAEVERLRLLLSAETLPEANAVKMLLGQLVEPVTGSIPKLIKGSGDVATVAGQLDALDVALGKFEKELPASDLGAGPRAVLVENVAALRKTLAAVDFGLLSRFAQGDLLPTSLASRFEWRPLLVGTSVFKPDGDRNLILSVRAEGDELSVTCSLDKFVLDFAVLVLTFERVQFRARTGKKPEIDVVFTDFKFAGALSFIETLRSLIPLDGFSDPPAVEVTPEGITAGFAMGLPNISVGVFSLENLSIGAGFTVPFIGPPMSTWFRFCERENPSRLTVSMFGGGFYFGVTVGAEGLLVAEGAIEFGAAISVNLGVASGSVSAMAGLYFKLEGSDITLAGYFRLRGEVRALGIVSICIELYLEMRYESGSGKCVGTATISVEIEVALFSKTIKISATKKFAGSGGDPTLAETLNITPQITSTEWNEYCEAFAA